MSVERALIMAAGEGTRFWPACITTPKANLPLGSRLLIDHIISIECRPAGIDDFTIMVPDDDHMGDPSIARQIRGAFVPPVAKVDQYRAMIEADASTAHKPSQYIGFQAVQPRFVPVATKHSHAGSAIPYGTAATIDCCVARLDEIGASIGDDEQLAVLNADDASYNPRGRNNFLRLQEAMRLQGTKAGFLVAPIAPHEAYKFGLALPNGKILEHPSMEHVPKHPAINIGRYILPGVLLRRYVHDLVLRQPKTGGECQLIQAISNYVDDGHEVTTLEIEGQFLNCGEPLSHANAHLLVARDQEAGTY